VSLAERRWLRLFTLCVLYVAQGIPWGFMATTLPPYLAERGVNAESVGMVLAMTTLPYAFKWVWGPIVDAFTIPALGRRRPWILFAQLMMAATVITMIAIPDLTRDIELLVWMIMIHTIFNSLQDVAVDALAIDLLQDDERGRANGAMYASKYLGGMIGGAGMATAIAWFGLRTALIGQAAILLAIMLVPFLVRERAGPPPQRTPFLQVLRSLAEAFTLRTTVIVAVLMLVVHLATHMLITVSSVLFTKRLGWRDTELTWLTGGIALFIGFGGSVVAGLLADVIGRRRMAAIASLTMGAGWLVFSLTEPWWPYELFVYGITILEALCQSFLSVALIALCMDVSWPRVAATQFTAYMAFSNFSSTIGYRLGGVISDWSYPQIYLTAALLQIAVTGLLLFVDPSEARRKLPLPAGTSIVPGIVAASLIMATLVLLMIFLVIRPML
jgi:PAT family beta-lactamase induction signal transducer AmpG